MPAANVNAAPDSGSWRRDKAGILLWSCTTLAAVVLALGGWVWLRQVAGVDDHDRRISDMEKASAARDARLDSIARALDEVRVDVKQLLRKAP